MLSRLQAVPLAARVLGFGGALPFLLGALAVVANEPTAEAGELFLLGYGAVILSFMGGVHWGTAMAQHGAGFLRLGASVVPALIGWVGLLAGGAAGCLILALTFVGLLAYDLVASRLDQVPAWYPALRWPLTFIVVGCLAAGALGS